MPSLNILTYGRSDLRNSLCAFGIARSGRIYVVAAGKSWHAGPVNDIRMSNYQAFGLEVENNGVGERWPAAQLESYARLCAELCRAFNIPPTMVQGHKEVCSPRGRKIDPAGIDMNQFRRVVAARLANPQEDDMAGTWDDKARGSDLTHDMLLVSTYAAVASHLKATHDQVRTLDTRVTALDTKMDALLAAIDGLKPT